MRITRTDPLTGKVNTLDIDVTEAQMQAWKDGELIQRAMPNVSADDREFIMTGYTPESWDALFADED